MRALLEHVWRVSMAQEVSNVLITAVRLDSGNISRPLILALAEHVEQCFEQGLGSTYSMQVTINAPLPPYCTSWLDHARLAPMAVKLAAYSWMCTL